MVERVVAGSLRNRIVFPIHDQEGPVVAYAGRSLDGASRDTCSRQASTSRRWCLISIVRWGIGAVRAGGGRILGLPARSSGWLPQRGGLDGRHSFGVQEQLLRERFPKLVLMLDGDEAGRRASRQLAARLRGKVSLSMAEMPSGRQPDQLSSEEIGRILRRASDAPGA